MLLRKACHETGNVGGAQKAFCRTLKVASEQIADELQIGGPYPLMWQDSVMWAVGRTGSSIGRSIVTPKVRNWLLAQHWQRTLQIESWAAKKLYDYGVFGVSYDEYLNYAQENRLEWENKATRLLKGSALRRS
jgi:hypothetical protein